MSYAVYPVYKHSGVEWLGEVPEHWSVGRLKHAVSQRVDRQFFLPQLTYIPLERIAANSGRLLEIEQTESESLCNRFYENDVLYGKLRPYLRKTWLADTNGQCSTELLVLTAKLAAPLFLRWWALSDGFNEIVNASTFGSKMPRADWDFIGNTAFPLPPLAEQQAIASFLDAECARIDQLIERQNRLIELLQEKRQAVITHAVTRGLNADFPLKHSGVEWLGEVPEHWEMLSLRRLIRTIEQGWSPQCENCPAAEDEWGVLKVGCVNKDSFDATEQKALPHYETPLVQYEIRNGDFLMSRANTKELVGSACVATAVRPKLLLCDKLYRIRFAEDVVNTSFAAYYLRSHAVRELLQSEATGASASMQNIGQSVIKGLPFVLAPIAEQEDIVATLTAFTARMDALTNCALRTTELMQERRSALISAAVTGKIDVRNHSEQRTH